MKYSILTLILLFNINDKSVIFYKNVKDNITGNEYGEALKKIIKNSENLRIVLLTATPMINLADEIIDLLNFIRPQDDMIQRDKIFTPEKNYLMQIIELLNMVMRCLKQLKLRI